MANATDIITYIGIPLAVLGVLPILYTFVIVILNQRRIRSALIHHGHKPITSSKQQDGFTIRSSPMTTLIEVELPKFAIAPLERHDRQYWRLTQAGAHSGSGREHDHLLERAESTLSTIEEGRVQGHLRGGSWRAFHWKKLIVGKKLYRIQYEDELREPPAEIDFPDLINFLLDWGAQLDHMGWEKLRSGGLWTPAGTVLLRLPHGEDEDAKRHHHDWVLRTVMPDESDGVLTVCMQWPKLFHDIESSRGATSLPPGWGRLEQPRPRFPQESDDETASNETQNPDLATRIESLRQQNRHALDSTSMRFKTESGLIKQVYWEKDDVETNYTTALTHIGQLPQSQSWFTTGVSSLLLCKTTSSSGGLWGFEPPHDIATFARKDTMPVGVMVLLGLLSNDKAPQWTTEAAYSHTTTNQAERFHQRMQAKLAAERLEATMPPEQARVARMNREAKERRTQHEDMLAMANNRRERDTRRFMDAIASSRISNKSVGEACLEYLVSRNQITSGWTIHDVTEATLYLMVLDDNNVDNHESEKDRKNEKSSDTASDHRPKGEGSRILKVLDDWMTWTNAGGMLREQFDWLEKEENKIAFCLATCVVAVVQEGILTNKGKGRASLDMLECLKMWRKVRLG